jgi:hypothetical protein
MMLAWRETLNFDFGCATFLPAFLERFVLVLG